MNKKPVRSTSTNTRLSKISHLDESSSLSSVSKSIMLSSSNSLERPSKYKLPHLAVPSTRGSNIETSLPADSSEESVSAIKSLLQSEWNSRGIPAEVQKVFNQTVWSLPRHKAMAIATRELEDLKHNRAAVQNAVRAAAAREESLGSIHEMNNYLKAVAGWEKMKDVQLECAELLHAHRILTINAVESIEKWRELIRSSALVNNEKSLMHIPFVWKSENYLVKMRNDLDFLGGTEFAKIFLFGEMDPLLVKPSQAHKKIKEKKVDSNYFIQHGQVVVSLPSSLRPKVEYAEEILGKEIRMESMLTPAQQEEVSKVIYEELCEEEIVTQAKDLIANNKPEMREGLAESIINNEINNILADIARETKQELDRSTNEMILPDVLEDLINAEIEKMLRGIVVEEGKQNEKDKKESAIRAQRIKEENVNLARLIYNDLFGDAIQPIIESTLEEVAVASKENEQRFLQAKLEKENAIRAQKLKEENSNLARLIYEDLFGDAIQPIVESTLEEVVLAAKETEKRFLQAKTEKENSEIAEKIKNAYIETIISEVAVECSDDLIRSQEEKKAADGLYNEMISRLIKEIAEEQYSEARKREEDKKSAELHDLSEMIYEDLFSSILLDLPRLAKEVTDDSHQIYSDRSELLENVGLEFAAESVYDDFSGFCFRKITLPESVLMNVIEEYYPKIPGPELNVTASTEKLEEVVRDIEVNFFWALIRENIVGLLVFSVDIDRDDLRVINVHHLTCLDWKFYPTIIDRACSFIWESDNCEEIRVQLYTNGPIEIPHDIKKVYTSQKFRWKTNIVNEDESSTVIVMGKMRALKMKQASTNKKNLLPKKK